MALVSLGGSATRAELAKAVQEEKCGRLNGIQEDIDGQ